ncbi:hypothetical protein BVG16_21045 [Paenibacillus selenitireducens]|uniref:DUF4825 domain-containing protein n=1 Tax=Paenibacillus selenitireducens TaxID=1324314 RepID=A0A1T2X5C1_9BACL|nr:hypothetical protein [Paenibacillus selenitireducens]OPA75101.1 hypothetical protein BVG16_21045 [Paenibacillus selenitireducens]
MKKIYSCLIVFSIISMFLISCTNKTEDDNDAIQFATNYKEIQFDVKGFDYTGDMSTEIIDRLKEHVEPLITEKYLDYQIKNRILTLPLVLADKLNATYYKLEDLHFNVASKQENLVNLPYNTNVILLNNNDEEIHKVKMDGTLTLVKSNDSWKVDFDNFNVSDFMNLVVAK